MRKSWKTIVGFALIGLAVAALSYVLALSHDYDKPWNPGVLVLGIAFFILCPPSWLFVMCIDCEVGGWDGLILYVVIIGLLNAALYAVIGAVIVGLRNKSN